MSATSFNLARPVSPWLELGAYEALWSEMGTWFKSLAEKFRAHPGSLPSDFVPEKDKAYEFSKRAWSILKDGGVRRFGIRVNGAGEYPLRLREAEYPVEVIYYQGWWNLIETRSVALVGTRQPTEAGIRAAEQIARGLIADKYTIVSGLARGIDTVAHETAIKLKAPTIAVIGTPLSHCYPKENCRLQKIIAEDHLLISQVPVCRYVDQNFKINSRFFPERNITMSALTEATVIVEASDTSGTLIQARAALKQGRKLFILEKCFNVPGVKWPNTYLEKGAIRVKDYDEIRSHLGEISHNSGKTTGH
jgi:DNA processing protein